MRWKVCVVCGIMGVFLPLQPSLHAQQVELRGTVAVHNSKYETGEVIYVQDAYLSAPFTVPATSDVEGNFVLEFVGLASGTALKIEAEKAGLEVVNTRELEEVVIGRKFPLRIYVAEKGKLAQAQTELYKISKQALFARRDALIARLRADTEESQAAMTELQARFGQELSDRFAAEDLLRSKIDEQQQQLPEFAMKLAKKNLDNASQLYIQAYEFLRQGKVEKTITILNSKQMEAITQEMRVVQQKAKALIADGEALIEQSLLQIQQVIESYDLKADALTLAFRYAEVATQYRAIIGIHVENELPSTDLAGWYDKLGQVLLDNGTYPPALEAYQKALDIREEVLDAKHPDLATSYANIGVTYSRMGRYDKALEYQQKALAIKEEVLDANHPYLAISYSNTAAAFIGLQQYKTAQEYLQKAIAIFKEKNHPRIITAYGRLGLVKLKLGTTSKAQEYFSLYNELAKDKDKALGAYYQALYHTVTGDLQKALDFLEEAVARGYTNRVHITQEELLAPLHKEARYQALVENLSKEKENKK